MSEIKTEEEQVEAIKKWWKENGTSVIAGVVIGLVGVFGWRAWEGYQDRVGKEASVAFNQVVSQIDRAATESASKQAELVRLEYDSTNYAVFAALVQARLKLEQGESAAARSQLEWAIKNSSDDSLRTLARLNLARILLNDSDYAGAAELAKQEGGGFASEFAELRGDLALAQQDLTGARDNYSKALALAAKNPQRVQMKLDDLGAGNL